MSVQVSIDTFCDTQKPFPNIERQPLAVAIRLRKHGLCNWQVHKAPLDITFPKRHLLKNMPTVHHQYDIQSIITGTNRYTNVLCISQGALHTAGVDT